QNDRATPLQRGKCRAGIQHAGQIASAGVLAREWAGNGGFNKNRPNIDGIEGIPFAPGDREKERGNSGHDSGRKTRPTRFARSPPDEGSRKFVSGGQQSIATVVLAPVTGREGPARLVKRTDRQHIFYHSE